MARGRTPAKAWMGTPDEADFYPPIFPVRHIFSMKEREHLKAFAVVRDKNREDHEVSAF
jgi:hypothetical protein